MHAEAQNVVPIFSVPVFYSSGGVESLDSTQRMVVTDVNRDEKPDLLVAHQCGSVDNNGNSSTTPITPRLVHGCVHLDRALTSVSRVIDC